MDLKRLACTGVFMTAIPLFANGCGADDLCCTEFEVGADLSNVDFKIEGEAGAQFKVLAQASADLAGAVSTAIDDVSIACENIARDLGAPEDKIAAENAKERDDKVKGLCALAKGQITATLSASGNAKLTVKFDPPKCEASVSAKANCQANCSVEGKCDIKANPPKCEGGTMQVSCSGSCKAEAGAAIDCKGSCDATVSGKCTAQGGVECKGKCEGTCKGQAQGGTGTGVQADGTCDGTCEGTCEVVKPGVKCEGSFEGKCEGTCSATASAKVECSGGCQGDFEPLKCEGGELKGGCEVDAKCDANCDASVSAKAECTPPALDIQFTASGNLDAAAQGKIGAVIDTLKVNLPKIIVVWKARGQAFVDMVGTISGSAKGAVSGDLGVKGTACLIPIGEALIGAASGIEATVSASAEIGGAAGAQ